MSAPSTKPEQPHLQRLDVLRGVAISLVVLIHFYWTIRGSIPRAVDEIWRPIFSWGVAGVPLFFVISGFCIHLSFLRSGPLPIKDFYWRRFTRIYPAYFASLLFFTVLQIFKISGTINFKQFILHALLVHNFFPMPIFWGINTPYWSLAIEFQFYLLYPMLLIWRQRHGLKCCLVATLLLSFAYELLCQQVPVIRATVSNPTLVPDWYGWILGACLAESYVQEKPFFPWKGWFVVLAAIFVVACYSTDQMKFICKLADYLLFGSILQNYLLWRGALYWWERALVPLGLVSYSVYLWHYPFIKLLYPGLVMLVPSYPSLLYQLGVYLPLMALCVGPLMVASYILMECRAMDWLRQWRKTRRAAKLDSAPGSPI